MQVTVTISDEMVRTAQERGMTMVEYVELLIDRGKAGLPAAGSGQSLSTAMERIRALRSPIVEAQR